MRNITDSAATEIVNVKKMHLHVGVVRMNIKTEPSGKPRYQSIALLSSSLFRLFSDIYPFQFH